MSQAEQSMEIESPSLRDGTTVVAPQQDQQPVHSEVQQDQTQNVQDGDAPTDRRRKRSAIWNYFEECTVPSKKERGKMENKVKCKACGALLVRNSSGTTTSFTRHLNQCDFFKHQQKSKKQHIINFPTIDEGNDNVDLDAPHIVAPGYYDSAKIRELICKMIIVHDLPFRIVEYTWFNVLLKALNPAYQKVSRNTIRADCMRMYQSEKEVLKKNFKDIRKISLTCDLWTSNQTICYMSLVAHYIDADWSMHCRVINFLELEPPHSGVVISNAISDCLAAWRIEDKIASITFDNASSNDSAVKLLLAKFEKRGSLWFQGKFLHVRCCAHILNLVVQDGLQVIEPLIEKVRQSIKYIKKSNNRYYKFNSDVDSLNLRDKMGLSLDCCTRWGSTFKMLQSTFHYRTAFDVYAAGDANYRWQPTEEEWNLYSEVSNILSIIHNATEEFSGSTYPTSNLFYPHIIDITKAISQLKQHSNMLLRKMADAMEEKFDKYWGPECNTLFAIAAILDPRRKMGMIKWTFPSLYGENKSPSKLEEVQSTLNALYASYETEHNKAQSVLKDNDGSLQNSSSFSNSCSVFSAASEWEEYVKAQHATGPSKSDLMKYLEDPIEVIPSKNFNILHWWRMNEVKYPIVSKLAKDVLTIPITTVSSESAFSTGGRVVDDYRSSLLPSMVEALVCASSWIRRGHHKTMDLEDDVNSIPLTSIEAPTAASVVGSN